MSTSINVSKSTVQDFLRNGKDHPFVIPEYQRPYAWGEDEISTLFEDLWDFTINKGGPEYGKGASYFLGSIVSYENENDEQEIIDGQQRITSLFLLLRAIYAYLDEPIQKVAEAEHFMKEIAPTIWQTDSYTGKIDSNSKINLRSCVVNNEGNKILNDLLRSGKADEKAKDNYSLNYRYFQKLLKEHASEQPLAIYKFIYALLNQAILLPISADSMDTALTIFSTLNNRGLPLSDADIFKAKIYGEKRDIDEKTAFAEQWQNLAERAEHLSENIQQLFYYYMFYLRARNEDKDTTTPGIRNFYSQNKFHYLLESDLLEQLEILLNLWSVINNHEVIETESWSKNKKICQILDLLRSYPNEFWKYPVVIYYLQHREKDNFEEYFLPFLRKLFVELLTKYIEFPTVAAVKGDILKLNIEAYKSERPVFEFKKSNMADLAEKIKVPHRKVIRMLLMLLAYEKQDELLPEKWEIEHILPQHWQNNYFNEDPEILKELLEHLGNKLPFEKRLNISAGDGYFALKKKKYNESKIILTKEMANFPSEHWTSQQISERDEELASEIMNILNTWEGAYSETKNPSVAGPTAEELAMIEVFKARGWV
ncbi:MAG: DUF262 domain-containing protein [Planctomycetaceae bacterium]|nr:DUF262 domain-containing protein [Planctomycetaceae bacterium]